jgi:hypothetical protein
MTREDQREGKVVRLSSKTKELLEIDSKHSAGGIFPLPVFIKSGKDSILKVCASSLAPFLFRCYWRADGELSGC